MATSGSVSYLFEKRGFFAFSDAISEDQVLEIGLEAGADDVMSNSDGSTELVCDPKQYEAVKEAFDSANISYETAQVTMLPKTTVAIDNNQAKTILTLIDRLEDDDDVAEVFANFELPKDFDA